eukprot:72222_1
MVNENKNEGGVNNPEKTTEETFNSVNTRAPSSSLKNNNTNNKNKNNANCIYFYIILFMHYVRKCVIIIILIAASILQTTIDKDKNEFIEGIHKTKKEIRKFIYTNNLDVNKNDMISDNTPTSIASININDYIVDDVVVNKELHNLPHQPKQAIDDELLILIYEL